MLLAAIGDIHGNLAAFQAVLADIDNAGIQTILCTGDCVVGHPFPNEVLDLVRSRNLPVVQGLTDRYVAAYTKKRATLARKIPEFIDAVARTHEQLRSDHIEFLHGLPKTLSLRIEAIDILLCHGAPSSPSDALHQTDDLNRFQRQRERAPGVPLIVCGQTHQPYARWIADTLFVNPGAVGLDEQQPPHASYAVIDTEADPWTAMFPRIPWD